MRRLAFIAASGLAATACSLSLPALPGTCPAQPDVNVAAHPASMIGGQARAPIAWQHAGATDALTQEAPLAGADVGLADGAGQGLPGLHVTTSANGGYDLRRVPSGYALQVTARQRTSDGRMITLRTLASTMANGATADLSIGSTILTLALLQGIPGIPAGFDPALFQRAVGLVYQHLANNGPLDPTDEAGMIKAFQGWMASDTQLAGLYGQLRGTLADHPPSYDDVVAELAALAGQTPPKGLAPVPSPSPVAEPSASATASVAPTASPAIAPSPSPTPKTTSAVTTFVGGNGSGEVDGPAAVAMFTNIQGLAVDDQGNLFVTEGTAHRIRKVTPDGTVSTISGAADPGMLDGPAAAARFGRLAGIAVATDGTLYVVDETNQSIRKIDPTQTVSTLAGDGGQGHVDGAGVAARFNNPLNVALDRGTGNLFVVELTGADVRQVDAHGNVTTVAGLYSQKGYLDGSATSALFWEPMQAALDGAGRLFVTDSVNGVIRRVDPADAMNTVQTFSGSPPPVGTASVAPVGGYLEGAPDTAQFNRPSGIAFDPRGFFIVADTLNNRLRKLAADGTTTLFAGNGVAGAKDGPAALAEFTTPGAVAIAPDGTVYVVDGNGGTRIRKIR